MLKLTKLRLLRGVVILFRVYSEFAVTHVDGYSSTIDVVGVLKLEQIHRTSATNRELSDEIVMPTTYARIDSH